VVLILFLTGVAWLSSVRVLKCSVYSTNERNSKFLVDKFIFILRIQQNALLYYNSFPLRFEEGLEVSQVCMALMDWATYVLQW